MSLKPKPQSKPYDLSAEALREHDFAALLGLDPRDPTALHDALIAGLPYGSFEYLRSLLDLPLAELSRLIGIPYRTLVRRRREKRLLPDESDRLARLARIVRRAMNLFEGDLPDARSWLREPQYGLGGRIPLEFAMTDVGAREVEYLIGRIEHGIPL